MSEINSDYKVLGRAKLTDNQINSLERSTPNLTTGFTYVIPAQIFHAKEDFRSRTGISNRVVVYEFDAAGVLTARKTLSLSTLRGSYFGIVKKDEPMPEIKSVLRDGLHRAENANYVRTIDGVQPALMTREFDGVKTAVITSPYAFKVLGRRDYWQGVFEETEPGRWDMKVNDDDTLQLNVRTDYELQAVSVDPLIKQCDLAKDEPNMKDYVL